MAPRNTKFNIEWIKKYPWINSVPKDNFSAYCKLCKKIFSTAGKGEGSVKQHGDSVYHQKNQRSVAYSQPMHRFLPRTYHFLICLCGKV